MRSKFLFLMVSMLISTIVRANTPAEVADAFYSAFSRHDSLTMMQLYADSEAPVFSDPIFPSLNSRETKAMWSMLVEGGRDTVVSYQIESATEDQVHVSWRAEYTYSSTGNKVVNEVRSTMLIRDGKIVQHKDDFNLCRWTWQALGMFQGPIACLFPSKTIHPQARAKLDGYIAAHPE